MPNQQDYAQGQINDLNYFITGQNPYTADMGQNALQPGLVGNALRGLGSQFTQTHQGQPTLSQFQTQPLNLQALQGLVQQYLGSAQQRALGTAGQGAGAYAASRGLNPYSFIQHAQAPIYSEYAGEQGKAATQLPQIAFQSQLGANQANIGNLLRILGLQQDYAKMLPQQGPDIGSILGGGIGAGIGAFGGPLLGAAGGNLGAKLFP